MVVKAIFLQMVAMILLFSPPARGRPQNADQSKFQIEIQPDAASGPKFTVKNLYDKTLEAYAIQMSISYEKKPQTTMIWDSLCQSSGGHPQRDIGPLEPGSTRTFYLSHAVGGPLPDRVEIVAGIWDDGEVFGEADWLKRILGQRAAVTSSYEKAIALLQKGLDENWTRIQFLEALQGSGQLQPFLSLRSSLEANSHLDSNPRSVQRLAQSLLAVYTRDWERLRAAKPQPSFK